MYKRLDELDLSKCVGTTQYFSALIDNSEIKNSKSGPFLALSVRSRLSEYTVRFWQTTLTEKTASNLVGSVADFHVKVKVWDDKLSLEGISYEIINMPSSDFVAQDSNSEQTWKSINSLLLNKCSDGILLKLTLYILEILEEQFRYAPAAKSIHHPYQGGLAVHTLEVMRAASAVGEVFNSNQDLILCGSCLHDIGKILELLSNNLGAIDYTLNGNLLGHCYMGVNIIDMAVNHMDLNLTTEDSLKVKCLKHVILSHHGNEANTAVQPAMMESWIIHYADMLSFHNYLFQTNTGSSSVDEVTVKWINNELFKFFKLPK